MRKNNKCILFLSLWLLLASALSTPACSSIWGAPSKEITAFLTEDQAEFARIGAYMFLMETFVRGIIEDLKANLGTYLTTNPRTLDPDFGGVIGFFSGGVMIAYVFAIAATGVYMVLSSSSPKSRAQAKYMLGKLVLGFILVAVSPFILHLFFSLSSETTNVILSQGNITDALMPYESVMMTSVYASQAIVYPQIITEWVGVHKYLHGYYGASHMVTTNERLDRDILNAEEQLENQPDKPGLPGEIERLKAKKRQVGPFNKLIDSFKMAPKPDFTFPFLMIQMFFILLLYGLVGLRYIMLMTWAILFPVAIFFSTFEPTKGLGRSMLEQTVFWTILQVFYALSLMVIAAGMQMLPAGFDYFKLGLDLQIIDLTISFFYVGACIVFLLTPLFVLSMVQRLMSL